MLPERWVVERTLAWLGVRRIRAKIADKRKALMDLARLRGWLDFSRASA